MQERIDDREESRAAEARTLLQKIYRDQPDSDGPDRVLMPVLARLGVNTEENVRRALSTCLEDLRAMARGTTSRF